LTATKKVTKEDVLKTKEEVEEILILFRDFVAQNRPQLDIEKVATGETWFGTAALERNLCDEIKTVDDIVTEYIDIGYDVLEIEYQPPVQETPLGRLLQPASTTNTISSKHNNNVAESAIQWLVRTAANAIRNELSDGLTSKTNLPIQERYRVQDDRADRVRSQD
jgi:ClpP class serine protease